MPTTTKKLGAIIFDLDNTLAEPKVDVSGVERRAQALELDPALINAVMGDIYKLSFDVVLEKHDITGQTAVALNDAYDKLDVAAGATLYPDVLQTLYTLQNGHPDIWLFLLTRGRRRLQKRKIEHFGLAKWFTECIIVGPDSRLQEKRIATEHLLERYRLNAQHVLMVGDNAEDEIAVGKKLGMATYEIVHDGLPSGTAMYAGNSVEGVLDILL